MNKETKIGPTERLIEGVSRFLAGAAFPVFLTSGGLLYLGFLTAAIFWPSSEGVWGNFATDFRIWCFDYNPATGAMRWGWAWIMLTQPFLLLGIALWFWWSPLKETWRQCKGSLVLPALSGGAATCAIGGGLLWFVVASENNTDTAVFPGERIRSQLHVPAFTLYNQYNEPVSLSDYEGKVVLITAIYSTCGTACPMLAVQAKRSVEQLPERLRDQVTILAITLDPENDTAEKRAAAAEMFGLSAPRFHFLNGDPSEVNAVLDRLQVARIPNETTGEIDHANLFFLIDYKGTIAYRFNLSRRHEDWLVQALRSLAEESTDKEALAQNPREERSPGKG